MLPNTGAGGKISSGRIPLHVCDTIMVGGTQELNACTPILFIGLFGRAFDPTRSVEVEIPEFQFRFTGRTDSSEHEVTASRGPSDRVACSTRESTCGTVSEESNRRRGHHKRHTKQFEVVFGMVQLVKADIRLDSDARSGIPQVGVAAGHNRKSIALRLP